MICSSHHKRGEEVMEFNLSPHYYKEFLKKEMLYNHKPIPVISEGWVRIGDYYHYMIAAPAAARAWRNNCLAARGARETGARLAGR